MKKSELYYYILQAVFYYSEARKGLEDPHKVASALSLTTSLYQRAVDDENQKEELEKVWNDFCFKTKGKKQNDNYITEMFDSL